MDKLENQPVWNDIVSQLKTQGVREIANHFDVSTSEIVSAMRRSGIKKTPKRSERSKVSHKPPIARTHNQTSAPKTQRIEAVKHLLGTRPDSAIAAQIGVHQRTVFNYRAKHGIPGFSRKRGTTMPAKKNASLRVERHSKITPFHEHVGKVPDRVVADMANASINTVRNYRVKHGIAAVTRGRKAPTVAVSASPSPQPPPGTEAYGWQIALADGTEGMVVAHSIAQAIQQAASRGEVIRVVRLHPMLA